MSRAEAEIELNAPIGRVWEVLMDKKAWKDFNETVSFPEDDEQAFPTDVGETVSGTVLLAFKKGASPMRANVTFVLDDDSDNLKAFHWEGGLLCLFKGTHGFILKKLDNDKTLLTHYEDFGGLVPVRFVLGDVSKISRVYSKFNEGLASFLSTSQDRLETET